MFLLEHLTSIQRNSAVGIAGVKAQSLIYSAVPCLFIPMSGPAAISNQFTIGRGYDVYMDLGTDVKVGDRLVRDGKKYNVKAVNSYETSFAGHIHVLAEQENS